ncbi:MAG: response regulator transcription factor [Planctomycetaceae bacterium]|nr:response regulator transcription factor [Planctomycetaceae bacterium]
MQLFEGTRSDSESTVVGQVYIVDDDQPSRLSVAALMEAMGLQAVTFPSGEAFLRSPELQQNGCLVADLRMLGMSGLELLKRMRTMGIDMPVIVVSAYTDVRIAVDAMAAGAYRVIEKPYQEQELWDCIIRAMREGERLAEQARTRESLKSRMERLTVSEREVLQLLIRGVNNKRISSILDMAPRTVDLRRRAILDKMQSSNIIELASRLSAHNLADANVA